MSGPGRRRLGAAYRQQVTPDHVGRRVTIRHRLAPDETTPGSGPTQVSDVVGYLRAWEDGHLEVERRDGSRVRIPEADVVASRLVPDPPVRKSARG